MNDAREQDREAAIDYLRSHRNTPEVRAADATPTQSVEAIPLSEMHLVPGIQDLIANPRDINEVWSACRTWSSWRTASSSIAGRGTCTGTRTAATNGMG